MNPLTPSSGSDDGVDAQDQELRRVRESREQTFPALLTLLCDQRRFDDAFDLELRREARLEWEREHGIT